MNDALNSALLRADLWRVMALAFDTPTEQSLHALKGLCSDLIVTPATSDLPFRPGLEDLAGIVESIDPCVLEHEYNAIFSMDVMVPAYEGSYQRIERGAVVGDVAGYYKAFDLRTADHSGPPDSLWNELAFMSWLSLKEAYAVEHGMEEALGVTRDAMREFLEDHLGRWVGAFSARLLRTTGNPFFVTAANLLLAIVSRVADDVEVGEIKPVEVRELPDESACMACPVASDPDARLTIPGSNTIGAV